MMDVHPIRLRGPWECETSDGQVRRVHMPAMITAANGNEYVGRLLCRRQFGCPTCLDQHEQVWLVIARTADTCTAVLNGHPLGEIRGAALSTDFDVTRLLRERNELTLEFNFTLRQSAPDKPLFEEVRLEIRG
jgi:beta-galactosidase/beta-glucuronidase